MSTTIASAITRAASKQTYYTIRFLADRERVEDAYRAYGYFRWVDDLLDAGSGSESQRRSFLERQKTLLRNVRSGSAARRYQHRRKTCCSSWSGTTPIGTAACGSICTT